MTSTKIITNTIYFAVLAAAIVLDLDNIQFYYGIVFVAIQIVSSFKLIELGFTRPGNVI